MKRLAGEITEDCIYITWHEYPVAILARRMNDACEEEYVFRVNWDMWDKVQPEDTIPGIDMSLRWEEYVRDHVPSFITEYTPPLREDTPELLKKLGLKYYDIWDVMIGCERNSVDQFRVRRINEGEPVW